MSLLALQGCVTMTGEADPENTTYLSEQQVSPEHKLYKGVKVGEVEGFAGTSVFPIMGKVSPNLNNDTARESIEKTLASADLLASSNASYILDAIMIDDGAIGAFGMETVWSGTERDIKIQYVLHEIDNRLKLYDEVITSHGEASCSDKCFGLYLQERIAAERSYLINMKSMLNALIAIK
jgi:hypothetical protein